MSLHELTANFKDCDQHSFELPVQVNVPLLLCVSAANLSGRSGGAWDQAFVRATSLLHSHFCNTETLQEAIIRSARQ